MRVDMTVNGNACNADLEPRTLLVDFLRDTLNLTGTKVGCDTGQCGACNVLLDGVSVKSCTVLAVQADACDVVTIEGVAQKGQLHLLQAALWEMHGVQCGFCTPGIVISLLELLQKNAKPSEADVRGALEGNLCRCTGYYNIVRAAQYAVESMQRSQEAERSDSMAAQVRTRRAN